MIYEAAKFCLALLQMLRWGAAAAVGVSVSPGRVQAAPLLLQFPQLLQAFGECSGRRTISHVYTYSHSVFQMTE